LDICPVDSSGSSFEEIYNFGICEKDYHRLKKNLFEIIKDLDAEPKELIEFEKNYLILKKLEEFKNFFKENIGYYPLKLQLYWAKRVLKGESFSIIAPTGIGKSTFGSILSHFYNGKIYYLVPSKILLRETESKLKSINSNKKILVIKEKEDKELLKKEDFDILITTSNFLHKNFDIIPKNFDLIFIDDADSLIRQPKNIDKVLKLIKFKDEEIEKALEIIDKKRKAKNKEDYNSIENLKINLKEKGIIIAASATLKPRTKRIALFRELLGFEIGSGTTYLRNIEETYELTSKEKLFERSIFWIKKLGKGGFIFLNENFRKEDLNDYLKFLNQNNVSAISYEKLNSKNQKYFLEDKIDVIVGFSNIRNPLTRGINLPQKVRYALFLGVPKFKLPLKISYSPLHLFLLAISLIEIIDDKSVIEKRINFLKRISFLKEEAVLADDNLKQKIEPIKEEFQKIIENPSFIQKAKEHPQISFEKEQDNLYLIVSDPRGYLQASGRTSRLFPLGLTKGLSLILAEDEKTLKHLQDKLKILGYETKFKNIQEINLATILKQIDRDRKIVKRILEGKETELILKDPIETALIIVESPTKAKTIANFFGKPAKRIKQGIIFYEVSLGNLHLNICATLGHFADLTYNQYYYGVKKDNSFIPIFQPIKICQNCQRHLDFNEIECSICHSQNFISKEELIKNLQKIAIEVDTIYLTSDPDTEGEKIAFDLFVYLYPYNQNIKRIELHEITKTEFIKKLQEPREIDIQLVKAQLLRRISDRWIGFKLSEEIQNHFQNLNLSAGRVQTPVLGWILEKEEKIQQKHYLINATSNSTNIYFYSENKKLIKKLKEKFKNQELEFEIKISQSKKEKINPLPPYDTSNLLKDANMFFRFDAQTTMKIAQELFEQGLITYHRTDSVFISEFGRNIAYEYLERKNLINLIYKRSWGDSGTHEGIRPTKPLDVQDIIESLIFEPKNLTKKHLQLYGLIFNRFLASQIKPSFALKSKIFIKLDSLEKESEEFTKIIQENHLKFFRNIKVQNLNPGKFLVENLKIRKVSKEYHYTQGELIDLMRKKGLGRPSTYSSIIQTLIERKYVLSRSGYLIPINWGKKIYNYLAEKHSDLISEDFTIKLEKKMDLVAENKENYQDILEETFKRVFKNELK
jgi:reverse gyrase